jgi:hypothetical protein
MRVFGGEVKMTKQEIIAGDHRAGFDPVELGRRLQPSKMAALSLCHRPRFTLYRRKISIKLL